MPSFDHAGEPPDRDRFAALILEGLRQAGETAAIRYDPETFSLVSEAAGRHHAILNSVYNEYRVSSPEGRARLIRNFVRSWFIPLKGLPDDFEDVHPDLLPALRSRAYIEVNCLRLRAEGAKDIGWPYRTVADHLSLSLVYDLPESITSIQQRQLDTWKVTFDDALARALENLAAISGHEFDRAGAGVWRSPWHDNLDTSRLMLLDLIRSHEVHGDPVAMIPNRDTLVLTGADDEQGLVRLAELAEDAWEHPRAISGLAVRLEGDEWVPFLPAEDHPAFTRLLRLRLLSQGADYNSQKKALEAWYEQQDEDVYVGPYSVATHQESGDTFSYCVWTESVDVSLPVAQRVFFVRIGEDEKPRVVGASTFARVQEHLGALLTPQDLYPPRYRVSDFPSQEQLAVLMDEEP